MILPEPQGAPDMMMEGRRLDNEKHLSGVEKKIRSNNNLDIVACAFIICAVPMGLGDAFNPSLLCYVATNHSKAE